MKNIEIGSAALERFVTNFLPERKLVCSEEFEFTRLAKVITFVLENVDRHVTPNAIFEVFYNLHYPMSVVEPLQSGHTLTPYIDTNSHAIYITADADKVKELTEFSKILKLKENSFTELYLSMHESLLKVTKDLAS